MKQVNTSTQKKDHYVPQFILKNFKSGKKKQVYVFDKHRKMSYACAVHDAACERGYYNIDIGGKGFSLENKIASLESVSSKIITRIVRRETLSCLNAEELSFLSLFFAVQFLRTQNQREMMQQAQESVLEWARERDVDISQIENFNFLDEVGIKRSHVHGIDSLALEFSEHFRNKKILLMKAPAGHQFLISDNPITMHNNKPRPGRGNLGIALEGIEVHMPISKRLSVTYVCSKFISELVSKAIKYRQLRILSIVDPARIREIDEIVHAIESGNARELKPENVEFHNSLQVIQSSRFIYSARDDFSLVIDMLRTNPECMNSPRITGN